MSYMLPYIFLGIAVLGMSYCELSIHTDNIQYKAYELCIEKKQTN